MQLSVVIVNWNIIEVLRGCLDSLKEHLAELAYEVIVVDNASSDGSVEVLHSEYPWVRLIANEHNLGFARGNNQAFEVARGEYLLILNPDTIVTAGSVQKLIAVLQKEPDVGIAGPRLENADGFIDPGCRRGTPTLVSTFLSYFLFTKMVYMASSRIPFIGRLYSRRFSTSGETLCVQGAAMLVRKKELDRVGYFDEQVPMYLDDIDLCYRFRKQGFRIYFCAESKIIHLESKSAKKLGLKKLDIIMIQAEHVFFKKHFPPLYAWVHRGIICVSSVLWMIVDCLLLLVFCLSRRRQYVLSVLQKHYLLVTSSLTGKFANLTSLKF